VSLPERPSGFQQLAGAWWTRQSASRQDHLATLAPLGAIILFLAAIILAFWYLRNEEFERQRSSVMRDTEITQQQIRLRLIENQEQLVRLSREIAAGAISPEQFLAQGDLFTRAHPEITHLVWLDAAQVVKARYSTTSSTLEEDGAVDSAPLPAPQPKLSLNGSAEVAFELVRTQRQPVYSKPFIDAIGFEAFQVQLPLIERNAFAGALVAEYSLDALMRHVVPKDVSSRHTMSLFDTSQTSLKSALPAAPRVRPRTLIVHEMPLLPAGNGLVLQGQGYRTSVGLITNTLFWMVVALSVLTVWMLLGTWRHVSRRQQMQSDLVTETNFRRAMENSMLTGMRAMDLEGRITYVNPAFSAMTGFAESDLVGRKPPLPHWPPDRLEENTRLLQQELQGRSPAGGIEVKVMRKDGSRFDARMYVSPLIDPKGQQTGWITSMTNITESKRVRDQLSASHERFTTVLEGLDAAVSVLSVQQGELLFANRSYRLWFGAESEGHALLAESEKALPFVPVETDDSVESFGGLPTQELTKAGSESREVYVEPLHKWFEVRARYLQWTDGRLAQMLIATDITARRNAETLAAGQAEKAQVTSRLVTMGEMASSVAHELNQPLTAIANYCNGMISRVKNNAIEKEDLIAALEKTSRQAQRAGQIIHRIRTFVKRSEPQRQPTQIQSIVDDALELAGIELRRRNVFISTYVAQRLPTIMVDPILIEQVLLNLLKNAAEAIDNARLPPLRRKIELRVITQHSVDEGGVVEFSVTDMGPGLKEEVITRLYEAFFSTKPDGMGIGLSLCRSIIESHQGRIKAQNLYNENIISGCRFTFTVPI
jgi:PAS domain S-box-containing protein